MLKRFSIIRRRWRHINNSNNASIDSIPDVNSGNKRRKRNDGRLQQEQQRPTSGGMSNSGEVDEKGRNEKKPQKGAELVPGEGVVGSDGGVKGVGWSGDEAGTSSAESDDLEMACRCVPLRLITVFLVQAKCAAVSERSLRSSKVGFRSRQCFFFFSRVPCFFLIN